MKKFVPGLLITIAIAVCAKFASQFIPGIGSVALAIILGIIVGNTVTFGKNCSAGIAFSEKKILTYAIALMGLELELHGLGQLGFAAVMVVLPTMVITIVAALIIGRAIGYSSRFSTLMGVGNVVCGSSAIAAVAPAVNANEDEIGVSIGIVNLMGTIGIFTLPILAHMLTFSDLQSSYLIGGVLQAIGQVVAAGFSMSDDIGDKATIIKMLRVLMIGPVVIIFSMINKSSGTSQSKNKFIPGYIIGFIVFSIIGSVFHNDTIAIPHLKVLAKFLLMIAMAGVGMKIRFSELLRQGPKALMFGSIIAAIQLLLITTLIVSLF